MRETVYQSRLVKKIETVLPGCFVIKNDPAENQGIPDLLVLFNNRWGMLEVKKSAKAGERPNQRHHVDSFNEMSFAAFIHPGNEEQVLNDLQSALGSCR